MGAASGLSGIELQGVVVLRMLQRHRAAGLVLAGTLTIAVALSFAPVRAAGGRFLSIFRVSRFEMIDVTPADLGRIEATIREGAGAVDIGNLGKMEYRSSGPQGLVSVDEARLAVDFQLRLPERLPQGWQLQGLQSAAGGVLSLTLDVDKVNAVLKSFGGTKMLPAALDGQTFTVTIPVVISAQYGRPNGMHLIQARSPELRLPGDASANAVRDAILALPFLPETVRRQVASVNDWQHTFLIPNMQGSTQEVAVDGTRGVFATVPAEYQGKVPGVSNALVWEKAGVVYAVVGGFSLEQGLQIADSMR
jgi:hypothetical protein